MKNVKLQDIKYTSNSTNSRNYKKLVWVIEEQNLQKHFVLHLIFALMFRNEHWGNLIYFVA